MTHLTDERAMVAAQPGAADGSAPGGDLVRLDRGRRYRPAGHDAPAVRVLLGDAEKLTRAALRLVLEQEADIVVMAEAASGHEAVALARELRPDVALLNVRLPGLSGLEATNRLSAHTELSEVRVLVLGDHERDEELFAALRAGASGFLTMDTEPAELVRAVRVLAGGGVPLSPHDTRRVIDELASQPDPRGSSPELFEELTVREREVVTLVALGLTNNEIAEQLVVSPATAKTHVSRSMIKVHARDRAKLVALAYQTGFAHASGDRAQAHQTQRDRRAPVAAGRR